MRSPTVLQLVMLENVFFHNLEMFGILTAVFIQFER